MLPRSRLLEKKRGGNDERKKASAGTRNLGRCTFRGSLSTLPPPTDFQVVVVGGLAQSRGPRNCILGPVSGAYPVDLDAP